MQLTRPFAALCSLLFLCLAPTLAAIVTDANTLSGHTYDYIVVGGGLAGLTVPTVSPPTLPLPCSSLKQETTIETMPTFTTSTTTVPLLHRYGLRLLHYTASRWSSESSFGRQNARWIDEYQRRSLEQGFESTVRCLGCTRSNDSSSGWNWDGL